MSRRRTAALLGAALVVGALTWASRDDRDHQPPRTEMEARVGVPLAEPVYTSSSRLSALGRRVESWWMYLTMPIPNQMAAEPKPGSWSYAFRAPPSYEPPPAVAPDCVRGGGQLFCDSVEGGWRYRIWFTPGDGRGQLSARPSAE